MKITQVYYERIHNLGNYENQKVGCTATVDATEDPKKVFQDLKGFVEHCLFDGIEKLPIGRSSK